MTSHLFVSNRRIQELEAAWRAHRDAAIQNNEASDGIHRRHAAGLERLLRELRDPPAPIRKHTSSKTSAWLPLSWTALAFLTGMNFGPALLTGLKNTDSKPSQPITRTQSLSTTSAARLATIPRQRPRAKQARLDPAITMQGRFIGYTLGGRYSRLDQGFDNYRRLSGTLARIQAVSLQKREASHQWPVVLLNTASQACFNSHHIGAYHPRCQTIKIDYTDGGLAYEHPAEIETTLAHEWGHHLIHLSQVSMSPTEQEVVSDCFAGAVFGYYARHGLATLEEASQGMQLLADVSNNSPMGHHPNQEVRIKSFLGGWLSIANPAHPEAKRTIPTCASLSRVIDIKKIRGMDLRWHQ